jgi:hypothetical protein
MTCSVPEHQQSRRGTSVSERDLVNESFTIVIRCLRSILKLARRLYVESALFRRKMSWFHRLICQTVAPLNKPPN